MKVIFFLITLFLWTRMDHAQDMIQKLLANEIQKGNYLEAATEETFNEFFERRMKNLEYTKIGGIDCDIIYSDSNWVYYGYIKGLYSSSYVDTLFKVDRKELIRQFPSYETIEGYHVKNKVYNNTLKGKDLNRSAYGSYSLKYNIKLIPDGILAEIIYKTSGFFGINSKILFNYIVLLDKNTLEILKIEDKIKLH